MCFLYETFPCLVHLTKAMSTWLGWPLNNGKDFPKSATQPTEMAHTVCNSISRNCFRLMRDRKLENEANGNEIPSAPFRTEKEDYLWRYSTVPNGFSGKLLFHLTFNQNFWIFFLLNGKHLTYQFLVFNLYTLNTSDVYKVNTFSLTSLSFREST